MTGKQSSVTDIKVIPSDALDSNHGLLVMNMRVGNEYKRAEYKERRIKIWNLKEKEIKEEIQKKIREKFPKDNPKTEEEQMNALQKHIGRICSSSMWKNKQQKAM